MFDNWLGFVNKKHMHTLKWRKWFWRWRKSGEFNTPEYTALVNEGVWKGKIVHQIKMWMGCGNGLSIYHIMPHSTSCRTLGPTRQLRSELFPSSYNRHVAKTSSNKTSLERLPNKDFSGMGPGPPLQDLKVAFCCGLLQCAQLTKRGRPSYGR